MPLFEDDYIKKYDKDHYKRHPKSLITVRIIYALLLVAGILLAVRAYNL